MTAPKLGSERVIVSAPMSFAGSARRIWRLTEIGPPWLKWVLWVWVAAALVAAAWTVIAAWYLAFGLFLVPFRLVRRGGRKRKRDERRHREILDVNNSGGELDTWEDRKI